MVSEEKVIASLQDLYFSADWREWFTIKNIPVLPVPPNKRTDYQERDVKRLLKYADQVLRCEQQLAPIGVRAMRILKQACVRYLNTGFEDESLSLEEAKEEWREVFAYFAGGLKSSPYLLVPVDYFVREAQNNLLNLYRGSFWARYGEMFAGVCVALGCEEEIGKMWCPPASLKEDWYDLARAIETEEEWYQEGILAHDECTRYKNIIKACKQIGVDLDETLDMIYEGGFEDRFLEADLIDLIKMVKREDFYALARRVYFDIWSIPLVVSPEEEIYISILRVLLETCRDTWFDCTSNLDDYHIWPATWYLLDYHGYQDEDCANNLPDDDQLRKEIYTKIIRETTKRLLSFARGSYFVAMHSFSRFHPISGGRRVDLAHTPVDVEIAKAQSLGRDWQRAEFLTKDYGMVLDTHFETMDGVSSINEQLRQRIEAKFQDQTELDDTVGYDWRSTLTDESRSKIVAVTDAAFVDGKEDTLL
ncbi:hypothetical protein PRK78_004149 [Emydomyces testavorans]|uniref:Uncharacterized protein n=1 Tax=Emydomyces testavorans TaxID=2070801 RepID=A0AAF0DHC4_9EURO|nr:hypothetical protein PRK78_004149 [Emydomyces testavorans]